MMGRSKPLATSETKVVLRGTSRQYQASAVSLRELKNFIRELDSRGVPESYPVELHDFELVCRYLRQDGGFDS